MFETLGISWMSLVWHTVNFIILLVVFQRFLYKPILRLIDQRTQKVRESLEQADFIKVETERVKEQSQSEMERAQKEGQSLIAQANQIGERIVAEARTRAVKEAEAILEKSRREMQAQNELALSEARRQVADLAILAASKVLGTSLDDAAHRQLVDRFIEESDQIRIG